MSIFHNNALVGAGGQGGGAGGYSISRSLRFNSADSAYLSRTPASAGNRKTWTFATWAKLTGPYDATDDYLLYAYGSGTSQLDYFDLRWQSSIGVLRVGGYSSAWRTTTAVFRDPSAWYHIVLVWDTTQATAANRIKLYVNGVEQTAFSSSSDPSLDDQTSVNNTVAHRIGNTSNLLLADCFLIDGQALDPTSFGEFDDNGIWQPIAYSGGSYGTNGFHLDFSDNSTAAALGTDTSGNGNTWTVNNISVTAGAGNDSLVDVPVNGSEVDTGAGGQVRGNYCTWNPLAKGSDCTLSNGNLDVAWGSAGSTTQGSATFGMSSGKWYWETTITASSASPTNAVLGITTKPFGDSEYPGYSATSWGYRGSDGQKWNNTSGASYGASYANGDVVSVAFDADNGTLTFYKNGSSQGIAFTGLTSGPYFPAIGDQSSSQTFSAATNFGARSFAYTAPSGFKALNTANLPAPLVTKPNTVFDVALWTGNGTSQTISGLNFSPDFVWTKNRIDAQVHGLFDQVRGADLWLSSNLTDAETNYGGGFGVTAFTSTGFTVGNGGALNRNGDAIVGWAWDAGSSTVTNTQGSISSQVRANASAGFSIVSYTGNGTSGATVGHGLGVAPSWIIARNRGSDFWVHYHASLGKDAYLLFDASASTTDASYWGSTAPTSSVFGTKGDRANNRAGANFIAYCFAPVAGYSAFGSYTGNGSASGDGPFVWTGMRPRWLLIKNASSDYDGGGTTVNSASWYLYDAARGPYNGNGNILAANKSYAEENNLTDVDFLANGFKIRNNRNINGNGNTMIYAAFAESPFQYARAR